MSFYQKWLIKPIPSLPAGFELLDLNSGEYF